MLSKTGPMLFEEGLKDGNIFEEDGFYWAQRSFASKHTFKSTKSQASSGALDPSQRQEFLSDIANFSTTGFANWAFNPNCYRR